MCMGLKANLNEFQLQVFKDPDNILIFIIFKFYGLQFLTKENEYTYHSSDHIDTQNE